MNLAGTAARGTLVTLSGQWAKFGTQFASIVILARLVTPDEFGKFAMIMAVVGTATILSDFGLSLAAIQAPTLTNGQRNNLFWINSAAGALLAGLIYVLAGPVSAFFDDRALQPFVEMLAIVFLASGVSVQFRADLTRNMRFVSLAVSDVAAQVVGLAVAVAVAAQGYGLWALVAQQVTAAVVLVPCVALCVRSAPGLPVRGANMRPLLSFGANTAATQFITYSSSNIDSVLLGKLHTSAELGVYDRAYQLFRIPMMGLAAPLTRVALPVLSKIVDDRERYLRYVVRAQKVLSYTLLGAFAFAAGIADPLLALVLGPGWDGAPLIFRILAVGGAFQALSYVYYWIFQSTGRVDIHLRYSLYGRLLMIMCIALGAVQGAVGAAIGSSVGFGVVWFVYTRWGVPCTGVSVWPLLRVLVAPVVLYLGLAFLTGCVVSLLPPGLNSFGKIILSALAGLLYLAIAWWAVTPVRKDVTDIGDVIVRAVRRK